MPVSSPQKNNETSPSTSDVLALLDTGVDGRGGHAGSLGSAPRPGPGG